MFRIILILILVLVPFNTVNAEIIPLWEPPARYQVPYKGKLRKFSLTPAEISIKCAKNYRDSFNVKWGCAIHERGEYGKPFKRCDVYYINRPVKIKYRGKTVTLTPEFVLRHELAHCNGWHKNHPKQ